MLFALLPYWEIILNYSALKRALDKNIRYLVVGDPVSHSRSPGLQNAAFEAAGAGRPYARLHLDTGDIPDFADFARKNLCGVNLTVPHKHSIIPFCDTVSRGASLCGSVNTLIIKDGKIHGTSTDGPGLEYAIKREFGCGVKNKYILFLGAGGACRATAFHFALQDAAEIVIANRTLSKAAELADTVSSQTSCRCSACDIADNSSLAEHLLKADLVIQTTSCGLKESDGAPIDTTLISADCHFDFFDTIYKETAMLKAARNAGLRGAGGRLMLIGQGAASFKLWTGIEPDISAMEKGFELPVSQEDTVC